MKPVLARRAIYTRAPGEEFAARITRVELTRVTPFVRATTRGGHAIVTTTPADTSTDEDDYDVFLAVAIHTNTEAEEDFLGPVPFGDSSTAGTWHWPT